MARIWLALVLAGASSWGQRFFDDDPLLKEPPPRDVGELKSRKLSDIYDLFRHTLSPPGERHRPGNPMRAQGVNTLGDPMDGAWWERRHYWFPMSAEQLQLGPGGKTPPADGTWTVIAGKTEGVTPGFTIVDERREVYFIKFDSLDFPELGSGADQISLRLFYALGYHVPDNYIVWFRAGQLKLGEEARIKDERGRSRNMMPADLAAILRRAPRDKDSRYRATASRLVPGKPLGQYRYNGTRTDDPNDIVPHEHRRDLRGMHLAAAWIDHDDSRAINTFDALEESGGVRFIRHYQLDFGSTLGSASYKPNSPRSGGEYLFGWKKAAANFFSLGLYVPAWARAEYPDLPAVGRFESKRFRPEDWVPEYPNPAFRNRLPDDDFWIARQIMNVSDADIRAIVETARYSDPRAARYVADCLIERRDKIGRYAFARVLPFDRFRITDGRLSWQDLAERHGFGSAGPVRIAWSKFDNLTEAREPLKGATSARLPEALTGGYWVVDLVSEKTPAHRIEVFLRKRGARVEVVGIERYW